MGIATPPLPSIITSNKKGQFSDKQNQSNPMSQDYHHQGLFGFSNGYERPEQQQRQQQQQQHIRRDKLRVPGFDPPPPLVGMVEEEQSNGIPVYETAGMLSEMFNFPSGNAATATELLENQISQSYRNPRTPDWFLHRQQVGDPKDMTVVSDTVASHHHHHHRQISNINAHDSAAAMQLFLMNPQQQQQQQRSPSPSPSHPPPQNSTSSTLHMLLPNPSPSSSNLQNFHNFNQFSYNPNEIQGVVEGQGLSLSLSSHLEAAKAEEFRIGEGGMIFFGQGGGGSTPALTLQGQGQQMLGSNSFGSLNMLRSSKYAKAAQELLEEFCSVGRGHFKKNKLRNPNSNTSGGVGGGGGGGGSSSSPTKDLPPLSSAERLEHQRRKVKLVSMLDEVDRRYNHYCEQMQMVVNSFDMVMGFGAAVPYTSLAQKAMSRHFRCLKDAIAAQLKHSCELLGEKDAGTSGVTKGETPRLRILEQSLRQQRAFNQMGIMEQEAWRPQRGLPERSVNILRAWLFEHFLHPYPSDADKHLLARQTGLSRNQVSNWFINARVRLWKPMVEEMYQQESKDETTPPDHHPDHEHRDHSSSTTSAQTPTPHAHAATTPNTTTPTTPPPPGTKRSEFNAVPENDPSFVAAINRQQQHYSSENQAHSNNNNNNNVAQNFPAMQHDGDTCRNQPASGELESAMIRFGASGGDVSLTLGLRHAGNLPRDFGGC